MGDQGLSALTGWVLQPSEMCPRPGPWGPRQWL